ncbi:CocE/NonD family hydrolase [Mesorhizobium sp. SB112]|uniref:CocE/NonD family hydrolase n=1 Tax=Mesorhizobium sp. SB112 TaxID=3151853 RepID=UPI003263567E
MPVRVEENIWIEMSDGCRLAARLWLPDDAEQNPVPAILEYIPYRKRDGTRTRDEPMHGYFASKGYAAIRVDMRGSGESDGHMADEYVQQEQDDALEVIDWLSRQPWCSGNVGMMGKSWGGFNCLQVAALRPPALKAIIPVCFTDDRFTDDVHYMGGCLLNDNLWWGAIMMAYQSRALDPVIVGEEWRERWRERLETLPHFQHLWLEHQRYDDYWKHGSICEDFSSIEVPVLAWSGWADSYTNAVFRVMEHLSVPRRAIVGPWAHVYPHDGTPTPAIGFLQEAVRWWDQWLKGIDTGIMDEPMVRAYVEAPVPPTGTRMHAPGRWVAEPSWPSPGIEGRTLWLNDGGKLSTDAKPVATLKIRSPQSTGKAGGEWMGAGCPGEAPTDQRLDDGNALVFDSDLIEQDFEILGAPELSLRLSADAPVAQIAVRLSDVLPDGQVTRVSYQVMNLTHRDSHENPEPLEPGKFYDVKVKLCDCGHRFNAGHKVRIAISSAYWPMVWPAPTAATISLVAGESSVNLPVRRAVLQDEGEVVLSEPEQAALTPITTLSEGSLLRYTMQDHLTGDTLYVTDGEGGVFGEGIYRFDEIDTLVEHSLKREMTINDNDPLSAKGKIIQRYRTGREGWMTTVDLVTEMTCDFENFYLTAKLEAYEDDTLFFEKSWSETTKRDLI